MYTYLKLLQDIQRYGQVKGDRTGTGTISLFGPQIEFDLSQGRFPLLTTKKLPFRWIVVELLWMLAGQTNVKHLQQQGVDIWDEWADEDGDVGRVYGAQWREWKGVPCDGKGLKIVDQIKELVDTLRNNPDSRRHIVTAWNPAELDGMNLPPCHCFFQCNVRGAHLDLKLYQRSADVFLGVPFNIASYALLCCMLAQVCGLQPGRFIHTFGDVHIYLNHKNQVAEQISRVPRALPQLVLNPEIKRLEDFRVADISVVNYQPHPSISAPVAV